MYCELVFLAGFWVHLGARRKMDFSQTRGVEQVATFLLYYYHYFVCASNLTYGEADHLNMYDSSKHFVGVKLWDPHQ